MLSAAKDSEALPNLPAVSEFVAGYEASGWNGLCGPKNTPVEIVEKLNGAIKASLADPKIKARFDDPGAATIAGSPAEFGELITFETEKWAKVIRAANIKAVIHGVSVDINDGEFVVLLDPSGKEGPSFNRPAL